MHPLSIGATRLSGAFMGLAMFLAHLFFAPAALAQAPVPAVGQRVTDLTGTLSVAPAERLASRLARLEEATGARVLVLVIDSLQGEPIEAYSQRVFDEWKPGRAGVDDGALLLLAKRERTMRIAVGRGLEGAVPDLEARRITREAMVPAFKAGRYVEGFEAALDRLEPLITEEATARQAQQGAAAHGASAESASLGAAIVALSLAGVGAPVLFGAWMWRRSTTRSRARSSSRSSRAYVSPGSEPDLQGASALAGTYPYSGVSASSGALDDDDSSRRSNDYCVGDSAGSSSGAGATDTY